MAEANAFDEATKPLDFASNMIQGTDVLLDWAKPESGIKYSGDLIFNIPGVFSAGDPFITEKSFLKIQTKESLFGSSSIELSLHFHFSQKSKSIWAQVFLSKFEGFDSVVLGDKIDITFQGITLGDEGYLLSFTGELLTSPPGEILENIFKVLSQLKLKDHLGFSIASAATLGIGGIGGPLLMLKKIISELPKIRNIFHRFSGAILIYKNNITPMGFNLTNSDSNPSNSIPWLESEGFIIDKI